MTKNAHTTTLLSTLFTIHLTLTFQLPRLEEGIMVMFHSVVKSAAVVNYVFDLLSCLFSTISGIAVLFHLL
jgi:hypothetical protein